jgi:hypothetical protein
MMQEAGAAGVAAEALIFVAVATLSSSMAVLVSDASQRLLWMFCCMHAGWHTAALAACQAAQTTVRTFALLQGATSAQTGVPNAAVLQAGGCSF